MVVEELKQVKKAEDEAAVAMGRARSEAVELLKQAGERAEAAQQEAKRQGREEGAGNAEVVLEQAAAEAAEVARAAEGELAELERSAGEREEEAILRLLQAIGMVS